MRRRSIGSPRRAAGVWGREDEARRFLMRERTPDEYACLEAPCPVGHAARPGVASLRRRGGAAKQDLQLHAGGDKRGFRRHHEAHDGEQAVDRADPQDPARTALRPQRPAGQGGQHDPWQAAAGGRAGETAGRHRLGRAGPPEPGGNPQAGPVPRRLPAAAASQPRRRRDGLSEIPHRRGQAPGKPRPDPLRPGLRPAGPFPARIPGTDVPHHAAGPGRCIQGQAGDHRQLLRTVQRDSQSQAAGRPAPAAHGLPAAAVQSHRRSPQRTPEPRRGLLRLPRQRPHQRRHPPGRRRASAAVPPSHRYADIARGQHPAPVRLAAGAEDRRGLHRVRTAGGLFRRAIR